VINLRTKIFYLAILLATVLTLDAHDFLHHHKSGTDNQCYLCIITPTLISDDINSGIKTYPDFYTVYSYLTLYKDFAINNFSLCESDRAPPFNF
jgi:hypothetical protein